MKGLTREIKIKPYCKQANIHKFHNSFICLTKSACTLIGFHFLVFTVNSNMFFLLTSKDSHMTTPEFLSRFSSSYVEFTEGTYGAASEVIVVDIFNPFMFPYQSNCGEMYQERNDSLPPATFDKGTQVLIKFLNFVPSLPLKM